MKKIYSNIIKKFCSEQERNILNKWTLSRYKQPYFQDANMDLYNTGTRLTTRFASQDEFDQYAHLIDYPEEVYNIRRRIVDYFHLHDCPYPQSFKDGIVNGIGFENGSICDHIDPIYYEGLNTLHCNILSQNSERGGVTIIDGIEHKINDGDLLCYVVSKHYHEVTKIEGTRNRILWVFGFCIDDYKMQEIFP
jgi:hypothetical protein